MKILIVHNRYRQAGGEDLVFESERDLLTKHNHDVRTLEFNNDGELSPVKLFYNSNSAKRLRDMVRYFRPDILHVHNLFVSASPAILIEAKRLNIPTIMTLHNYRLMCANALLLRDGKVCEKCVHQIIPISGIIHACYRQNCISSLGMTATTTLHRAIGTWKNDVIRYIALTKFGKEKILSGRLGLEENKVSVKANFLIDPGIGKANRENKFLFVGRLSEEKGIATLLEAHRKGEFELEIIGDGPMGKEVELASANRTSLLYHGSCSREFVLERMKKVKGVIIPSVWYEGLATTLIEALACGTPVIASRIGAFPEVINSGKNGFLFPPKDAEALRGVLNEFPENQQWEQMSSAARKTYLDNYTPEDNYRQLMTIYQEAIQENKHNSGALTEV